MSFQDKPIKCMECGMDFVYTGTEQELHSSLGYKNEPKRCQPCRDMKKKERSDRPPRHDGGGGGSSGPRQTFSVICAECGKEAQVPFKPTGSRPVYCNDCFSKKRASM